MAEYFEREALLKYPIRIGHYDKEHGNKDFVLGIESVMEYAEALPAADVVEVKHGRWEEADDGDGVVCSICREDFCSIIHEVDRFRICPNCGARMDGDGCAGRTD